MTTELEVAEHRARVLEQQYREDLSRWPAPIQDAKIRELVRALADAVAENHGILVIGVSGVFTAPPRPIFFCSTGFEGLSIAKTFYTACAPPDSHQKLPPSTPKKP